MVIEEVIGINVTEILETIVTTELNTIWIDVDLKYYVPMFDPLGPYMIYPQQCYPARERNSQQYQYRAPIIGYISTGSEIEKDIVS